MLDEAMVRNVTDGMKRGYAALKDSLGIDEFSQENGVDILRGIARHLVYTDLGREPTTEELNAILAGVEAELKGGE